MTDEQRKLRLKEIDPLKTAMISALERAETYRPPLHVSGKHGLHPWTELTSAVFKMSIDDKQLFILMEAFQDACKKADAAWFAAQRSLHVDNQQRRDHIVNAYMQNNHGPEHINAVHDTYVTLSRYLETLLA